MNKFLLIILLPLAVLGLLFLRLNSGTTDENMERLGCNDVPIEYGEITTTINGRGILTIKRFSIIPATGGSKIQKVLVHEGDEVEKGACLARVEADVQFDLELHNVRGQSLLNERAMGDLENKLARQKKLYDEGFIPLADIKDSEKQLFQLKTEGEILAKRIRLLETTLPKGTTDISSVNEKGTSEVCIKAPFSGTVMQVFKRDGDLLRQMEMPGGDQESSGLLALGDLSEFFVEYKLSEINLGIIKKGQKVNLVFDSYPDTIYDGVVEKISSVSSNAPMGANDNQRELSYYLTKIKITDPGPELKQGLSCRVSFITDQKKNVLVAPITSLMKEDKDEFVFTLRNGALTRSTIHTGLIGESFFEIKDGIVEGDKICTDPYIVIENEALLEKRRNRNLIERMFN